MEKVFICHPKCTTCQKAKAWLEENRIPYVLRSIVAENPTRVELEEWVKLSGLPVKRFFNTSGMVYRELDLKARLAEMTEAEQLELLASDGMLVKRPLLVTQSRVWVGFKAAEWEALVK